MSRPIIQAFWPRTPRPGNMGDLLTPKLISWLYGKSPEWTSSKVAGIYLVIGSIIKFALPGTQVWGAGAMWPNDTPSPGAIYHAVRGPLTREVVLKQGGECPEVYGDPSLLLPRFHKLPVTPRHKLGIVPHYVDYQAALKSWGRLPGVSIINVLRSDPLEVIDEIRSCEAIVSSSLHGVIVAQAYGIPAAPISTIVGKLNGDGMKFRDYFLSTGQDFTYPIPITGQENIEELLALVRPAELKIDMERLLRACPFSSESNTATPISPVVISFYTPDYAEHAERLRADCDRIGIDHIIEPLDPVGEWFDNTRLKGRFVYDILKKTDRPVLWIDADGSLLRWPALLSDVRCDFAAFAKPPNHPRDWSTGTLYFAPTKEGISLAKRWAYYSDLPSRNSDELALSLAWEEMKDLLTVIRLPKSYFSLQPNRNTVILHRLSGNASKYNKKAESCLP